MQIEEKEMNLEDVEKELTLAKYKYRDIENVDFTPVNEHFYCYMVFVMCGIFLGGISVLLASGLPLLYQITGCMILAFLITTPYNLYPNIQKKFYLSNFPTKDLAAIKSDQFLCSEFKKHLIDNDTGRTIKSDLSPPFWPSLAKLPKIIERN